jgi:hypothetical protein
MLASLLRLPGSAPAPPLAPAAALAFAVAFACRRLDLFLGARLELDGGDEGDAADAAAASAAAGAARGAAGAHAGLGSEALEREIMALEEEARALGAKGTRARRQEARAGRDAGGGIGGGEGGDGGQLGGGAGAGDGAEQSERRSSAAVSAMAPAEASELRRRFMESPFLRAYHADRTRRQAGT